MNTAQIFSQLFSYSFIFLLGVIVGAWAEMYFDKRQARNKENAGGIEPSVQEPLSVPAPAQMAAEPAQEKPSSREVLEVPVDRNALQEEIVEPALPPPPAIHPSSAPSSAAQYKQPAPAIVVVEEKAKELSIAEQIDEILEELQRFSGSSLPIVSLKDDGHQGVIVKVGNKIYPGIDAIPDQEVKELIRTAVTEWERRSARK
jgi:hypothetical protein